MGAASLRNGWPVTAARTAANARNDTTYVAVIWNRPRLWMITLPKHHTTTIGSSVLPHCTLSPATVSAASTSIATMPKLDGFQMWRPSTRSTYFEVMEMAEHRAYGHIAGERTSMPTLMPEM